MTEVEDGAVDLAVTSPPYWHIKDYGVPGQIGYGQSLHEYLKDLYHAWRECFRVLREGARLCINVGDQFARAAVYGRLPGHPPARRVHQSMRAHRLRLPGGHHLAEKDHHEPQRRSHGHGLLPVSPNGIVEIDYEFILIFKKPGLSKKVAPEIKAASKLTKAEWKEYFAGHWHFGGVRQAGHEAMFPEELPRRLIKMFTFVGDTVLDPFLGSGTTVKAALDLERNAVGYEINPDFSEAMPQKIGGSDRLPFYGDLQIIKPNKKIEELPEIDYTPAVRNAVARPEAPGRRVNPADLHKVTGIIDETSIELATGLHVRFLGVRIDKPAETLDYLRSRVLGKNVLVKNDQVMDNGTISGYVYLKNRIFINIYLIKVGLGSPDLSVDHKLRNKFITLHQGAAERPKPQNPD